MLMTRVVTRPTGVSATTTGPFSLKCSGQTCSRGLKSETVAPFVGSMPLRLDPLCRLQW